MTSWPMTWSVTMHVGSLYHLRRAGRAMKTTLPIELPELLTDERLRGVVARFEAVLCYGTVNEGLCGRGLGASEEREQ